MEKLRCILALRISSRGGGDDIRATLKPSSTKLSIRHALLRLKTSKELGLTEQGKYIRG